MRRNKFFFQSISESDAKREKKISGPEKTVTNFQTNKNSTTISQASSIDAYPSWPIVLVVVDGKMGPGTPSLVASSTVTTSDVTLPSPAFYVLDISLISAQNLAPACKSMRPYAITWIHPSRKLTSRVDQQNHNNPLWNDRFAFRVDSEFLSTEQAAVTVEIYTVSWFKDVLVGTVCVLISDLITLSAQNSTRYVALQIRRPSGNPQGILNMGVALMDATKRSMPLYKEMNPLIVDYRNTLVKQANVKHGTEEKDEDVEYEENPDPVVNEKIHLWRSYSRGTNDFNEEFSLNEGSVCNGSVVNGSGFMCNGSELCSDVGPSASIVAAEIARKLLPPVPERMKNPRQNAKADNVEDTASSIVEEMTIEEATAKGLKSNMGRLRKEVSLPRKYDGKFDRSKSATGGHSRRHSDGRLFSWFGNACGFEFTIVCGAGNHANNPNVIKSRYRSKRRFIGSETNSS